MPFYPKENWQISNWDDGHLCWGYMKVKFPQYPGAINGWAKRCHVVWWLHTGQVTKHPFLIHHKNEDKLDDRLENLEYMHTSDHHKHHLTKALIGCKCKGCGEIFFVSQGQINKGRGKFCSGHCYHNTPISESTREALSVSHKRVHTR